MFKRHLISAIILTALFILTFTKALAQEENRTGNTSIAIYDAPQQLEDIRPNYQVTPVPDETIQVERSSSTTSLMAGQEVEIKFNIVGNTVTCDTKVVRSPLDIIMVIDHSGSMEDSLGTDSTTAKLDAAKQAAISFLDAVELGTEDQVGIATFADRANKVQALSTDKDTITRAIQGIPSGGGTNISDGLLAGDDLLKASEGRADALGVIILLSDGQSPAQDTALGIKNGGIRIITVGLGQDVNENELRAVASAPEDYYFSPDTNQLASIFTSIARNIQKPAAGTDFVLEHHFDATNFEVVDGSINPSGQLLYDRITWHLPNVGEKPITLNYRLRTRVAGNFNADLGDSISYLGCGQSPTQQSIDEGLPLTITPNLLTPTVIPTAASTPLTPKQTIISFVCGDFPWWWLIAFLLALAFLVLFLRNYKNIRGRLSCYKRWPKLCQLIWILFGIYCAFLIGLLLHELQPVICQPREAIYFWRITPDNQSAIFYKPTDPDLPLKPYTPLNKEADCIACHSVAEKGDRIAAIADGSNGRIVVKQLDGTPVSIPPITGSYLSLSPDGSKLAYAAEGKDIYILDIESGTSVPLQGASDPGVIETMPAWSPDGGTLAFVRALGETRGYALAVPCDIYTVPSGGGVATLLPGAGGSGFNYYPAYSPDGRWLAFTYHAEGSTTRADPTAEIYLIPAQGGEANRLAANDFPSGQELKNVSNSWPSWSPDGRFLAFNSKRNGNQFDIFITTIDPDGNSGPAKPLAEASQPDAFEHLPQWGYPPQINWLTRLLALLPWLILLPVLYLLARLLCQNKALPDTISLARQASPDSGIRDRQTFTVDLTLYGDPRFCDEVHIRNPLDVILTLDVSGSMSEPAHPGLHEQKLEGAKAAARAFVAKMDPVRDRVGIVAFDTQANVLQALDANTTGLENVINGLTCNNGTAIDQGLKASLDELQIFRRPDASAVIVLLSDGESDTTLAVEQSKQVRNEGVRLITVAFGHEANEGLLKQLVTRPEDALTSASNRQLEQVFTNIAERIQQPIPATEVYLIHRANVQDFELNTESIRPSPMKVEDGVITWRIGNIGQIPLIFHYQTLAHKTGTSLNLDLGDIVKYKRCGDLPRQMVFNADLPVTILEEVPPETRKKPRKPPKPLNIPEMKSVWDPDDVLLIGVGTFGRQVLTHLMKNLRDAGGGNIPSRIQFLLLDTAKYMKSGKPLQFAGVHLDDEDVIVLDENLRPLITKMRETTSQQPELMPWFDPNQYTGSAPTQTLAEGTHGKRPLARTGLLRKINGKAPGTSLSVPQLLTERIKKIHDSALNFDKYGLRVVLIGSLSEGIGSCLWDIAYLAKEQLRLLYGEGVPSAVEGYLEVELAKGPNDNVSDAELNALTGMRELSWFQLNPGMPYRITYSKEELDDQLKPLTYPLLDSTYLFPFNETPSLDGLPAVVSDVITLRLDRPACTVGDQDWYEDQRNNVNKLQQFHHELFFGTGGGFTLRLPAYDIIEMVKTRWAMDWIRAFIMGNNQGEIRFSSEDILDNNFPASPSELTVGFWDGYESGQYQFDLKMADVFGRSDNFHKLVPEPIRAMIVLVGGQRNLTQPVTGLSRDEADLYLRKVLYLILMGSDESSSNPRCGKIEYAIDFLHELEKVCKIQLHNLSEIAGLSSAQIKQVQENFTILLTVISQLKDHLEDRKAYLGKVIDVLYERSKNLGEWQKDMDAVEHRIYVWQQLIDQDTVLESHKQQTLADQWYDFVYQTDQPEKYSEYFSWDEKLHLQVLGEGIALGDLSKTSPAEFVDKLLEFVGARTNILWEKYADLKHYENDAYAALANRFVSPYKSFDQINQAELSRKIGLLALPASDRDQCFADIPGRGETARRAAFGKSASVAGLLVMLGERMMESGQVIKQNEISRQLNLSDPLCWQFVRTVDSLNPTQFRRYDRIMNQYSGEQELRAVFEWEAINHLRRSNFFGEYLHPIVAVTLINEDHANAYGLAYATGWIRQGIGTYSGIWGIYPEKNSAPLFTWTSPTGYDPAVFGLLQFVYRAPADVFSNLRDQLSKFGSQNREKWLEYYNAPPHSLDQLTEKGDLKSLRLLAKYAAGKSYGEL